MKRVLITGAGFIGLHLATSQLKKGNYVTLIGHTKRKSKVIDALLAKYPYKLTVEYFDIATDLKLPYEVDEIYHLAASVGTKDKLDGSPGDVIRNNTMMMLNIIDTYKHLPVRIIFASTIETVTGLDNDPPYRENDVMGWKNPFEPRWAYSFSKAVSEILLYHYGNKCKFTYGIARLANVYGEWMGDYVIKSFIKRMLSGENPFKIHSPNDTRAFCYVSDVVEGLEAYMKKDYLKGIINIGNDEEVKISDMAKRISAMIDPSIKFIEDPFVDKIERRCPDISSAGTHLMWSPKVTLNEGLAKTIKWFKEENET